MSAAHEEAKRQLHIREVYLRQSNVLLSEAVDEHALENPDAGVKQQGFRSPGKIIESELRLEGDKTAWRYEFRYHVGARLITEQSGASTEEGEGEPLLLLEAVFTAHYWAFERVNSDALKAFAAENVGYHVWPYWREYVQTSCARMGLKQVIEVPHYMIQLTDESEAV